MLCAKFLRSLPSPCDSSHSCGIWRNLEELNLAEGPAKFTIPGMTYSGWIEPFRNWDRNGPPEWLFLLFFGFFTNLFFLLLVTPLSQLHHRRDHSTTTTIATTTTATNTSTHGDDEHHDHDHHLDMSTRVHLRQHLDMTKHDWWPPPPPTRVDAFFHVSFFFSFFFYY